MFPASRKISSTRGLRSETAASRQEGEDGRLGAAAYKGVIFFAASRERADHPGRPRHRHQKSRHSRRRYLPRHRPARDEARPKGWTGCPPVSNHPCHEPQIYLEGIPGHWAVPRASNFKGMGPSNELIFAAATVEAPHLKKGPRAKTSPSRRQGTSNFVRHVEIASAFPTINFRAAAAGSFPRSARRDIVRLPGNWSGKSRPAT